MAKPRIHTKNRFRVETPVDKKPTQVQRDSLDIFVSDAVKRLSGKPENDIDNYLNRVESDPALTAAVGPILAGVFKKRVLDALQKKPRQ